ncbi:MAG: hypothetical protein SOX26_02775 [Phocaeicola sp.]|nr:hypothetical protein [Phocaeicola sp.]
MKLLYKIHISTLFYISLPDSTPKVQGKGLLGDIAIYVMILQKSPGSSALYSTVIAAFPQGGINISAYGKKSSFCSK